MKRILYSCFLFTFILFSRDILAQPMQATITVVQCYNPGNNYALGIVTQSAPLPCATPITYTWNVLSPPGPGCAAGQTVVVPSGTANAFYFPCCGTYSFYVFAHSGGNPLPCDQVGPILSDVECPVTPTLTNNTPTICAGVAASITVLGAFTWTWTPGPSFTGGLFNPTPSVTTTYTGIGKTANGCTVQPVVTTVTVQSLSVNITPPSQTVCVGSTVTLNSNGTASGPGGNVITYQWYELPVTTLGTGATQTVAPVVNTTYSLNAFVSTCSVSATNTIAIGTAPSLIVTASSLSVCTNETFTLDATSSATSYTWTQLSGGGTATFNPGGFATPSQTFAIGAGVYSVTAENTNCAVQAVATVTVDATLFVPTITTSSANVCPGETFTLTGGGGAANSYTWMVLNSLGVVTSTAVTQSSVAILTQTGTTSYSVQAESPGGCVEGASITIGTVPDYTTALAISQISVCAANPVTLTASGALSYTFVANNGSGTFVIGTPGTNSVAVDSPTANTTYTVYGGTSGGFCATQATAAVTMITGGTLTLSISSSAASGAICAQQIATLTAFGAINYTWSPIGTFAGSNNTVVAVQPTLTTTYTVFGSNNGGCVGFANITVTIDPAPNVYVTYLPTGSFVCAGFTSTLTANGAASYQWTGSNFTQPVFQPSISVSPGPVIGSAATFTVIGYSALASCPSTAVVVQLFRAPPLTLTSIISPVQATTCIETNYPDKLSKPVILTVSGAQNYVWFPYNPAYMTYSLGPQTTVRPPTSTCYTVTGITPNCTGTLLVCVSVIPQFTMTVVPPLPAICLGDSIKLSITSIQVPLAVGPSSLYSYSWSDPPTSPPPSITAQNTQTVLSFPQVTSTYSVQVFDARLCASLPRLVTVTVLPQPLTSLALPIINNVPTNTLCYVGDRPSAPDNKLDLTAMPQNLNLPFGVTPTYTWTGPENPPTVVTPSNMPQVTVIAPHRTPATMVFTVITGYNGIQGCKRTDTISVRVIDCRPVTTNSVHFIMDIDKNDTICAKQCITFQSTTDTLAGGPQTFTWTFKGGLPLNSNDHTPTVCYDLPGEYDVVLTVANPYPKFTLETGSAVTTSFYKLIHVVDYPNVTIVQPGQRKSDTTIKFSQSIVLTATNALTYTWSPRYSISATHGSIVTVNPTKTTMYIVTGKASTNCYSNDTITVHVIEDCGDMFVPNAFSPNGDEVNDVLYVRGVCLETLTFMVFNRWGEKVFETNDVAVGWDGTFHGEKMNTGVFVYRLEGKTYEGKGFTKKGNITLIR